MKIKLRDLQPNPFKKYINDGKLSQEKVDRLKESIGKDGFWSGLMAREVKGVYQIPFGHHRTEAAKQVLGGDHEIDIPVRNLSDEQMVRMLINENSMQNEEPTIYQFDLVIMARNWLAQHVKPRQGKGAAVSARDISVFLGEKNWSERRVSDYIRMRDKLSPVILEKLKNASGTGGITVSHARSMARLNESIQEEVCDEMQGKDITHSEMNEAVIDIGKGVTVKEAIRKSITPLKGRRIMSTCESLMRLVKKNPLSKQPQTGQEILRPVYSQLVELLTKEMED